MDRRRAAARVGTALVTAALLGAGPGAAVASCLSPAGDITNDGATSVVDVQCAVLVVLWKAQGAVGGAPLCLGHDLPAVDPNCDGNANITDVLVLVAHALGNPLDAALDGDANGCVDFCEIDSDGDGTPDAEDCAPYSADAGPSAEERCDGWDNDCDGEVDEAVEAAAWCSDGNACNGAESCPAPPVVANLLISEIMIQPSGPSEPAGEWIEVYNPTPFPADLSGWTLTNGAGQSHTLSGLGGVIVPARGFALLARSGTATNGGVLPTAVYDSLSFDNTAGDLRLIAPGGTLVSRVPWDTTAGWTVAAGHSIARVAPDALGIDPGAWAVSSAPFGGGQYGTPRGPNGDVANTPCLPGIPPACDDTNPCTTDACAPATGCQHAPVICDDGVVCTVDTCLAGVGCSAEPDDALCDDDAPCTDDVCIPGESCWHYDADCDDGDPWTTDACDLISGCVFNPVEVAYVGPSVQFDGWSIHGAGYLIGQAVAVPTATSLLAFGMITTSGGQLVQFGLYTDSGGAPGTLVAQSAGASVAAGWNEYDATVPGTPLPAGTYWIMAVFDNQGGTNAHVGEDVNGVAVTTYYKPLFYGSTLPNTFGSTTNFQDNRFNQFLIVPAL